MKTSMKKRIVSAVLTLAMVASFLPTNLFPRAEAVVFPNASLEIDPETGEFTATFSGVANTVTNTGNWYYAVVPNIGSEAEGVVGDLINTYITSENTGPNIDPNLVTQCGLVRSTCYFNPGGAFNTISGGSITFTGPLPPLADVLEAYPNGFYTEGGVKVDQPVSVPYIIVFFAGAGSGAQPYNVAKTEYSIKEATLVLTPSAIEARDTVASAGSRYPVNQMQANFKAAGLSLKNVGKETAHIDTVTITNTGGPAGIGAENLWTLWYDKDGTMTPIPDALDIPGGETVTVYMQRRLGATGANALKLATGTANNTLLVPSGATSRSGDLTLEYSSLDEEGVSTGAPKEVKTTWAYTVGEAQTFTVTGTASPSVGGTVKVNGTDGSASVTQGTRVSLVATPADGYVFSHWSGGNITDTSSAAAQRTTYTVTSVQGDMDFVAHFTAIPTYTVSGTASPSGGGTITVNGTANSDTVQEGESATLEVTPNSGYRFTGWTGGDITGTDTNTTHTVDSVTSDLKFTANFDTLYNVSYNFAGGSGTSSGETGILDTDEFTLPSPGTKTGSTFQGWYTAATGGTKLGDVGDKITLRGANIVPSSAGGTATIYAQWTGNNYDVTANVASTTPWGTVKAGSSAAGSTSTASVAHGGNVTLVATPSNTTDYGFDHWEYNGSSVSTSASYAVPNVTEARNYTAYFKKNAPTYTGGTVNFTYETNGTQSVKTASGASSFTYTMTGTLPTGLTFTNGSISGTPSGTGAKPGDYPIVVTATAANGETVTANWTVHVNKAATTAPSLTATDRVTTTGGNDGSFTITNYNSYTGQIGGRTFELSTTSGATSGTAITPDGSGKVTGQTVGTKYVRVAENDYYLASSWTSVTILGPTTGFAEITVKRNDQAWSSSNGGTMPTITLQGATGATSTVTGNVVKFSNVTAGTYKVYAGGEDTGVTVRVAVGDTATGQVDYYSVAVQRGSGVANAGVNTTGSDSGMADTKDFLKGKTAYLRATPSSGWGGGTWSFALNGGETQANINSANTSITVKQYTTATINFTQSAVNVTPKNATLTYGTQYGVSAGGSGSVEVATITTTGDSTDTYTYGAVTGTLPAGMTLERNANGTITIWGKPQVVTSSPVTISFDATSAHNGSTKNVSFTVGVNKYTSTITVTPTSGSHYVGDSTASSVTTTFTGPYYNGSTWVTVDASQNSSVSYSPTTLTGTTSCSVTATVTATGGSTPLADVWTTVTGNGSVPLQASHDVVVNVQLDGTSPYRSGETVTLKTTAGAAVQNGTGTLSVSGNVATVTLKNVPDFNGNYDLFIGSDTTRATQVRVYGNAPTVNINYYTLTLTAGANGSITGQSPANGIHLSGTSISATASPSTGYAFKNWTNESGTAMSLPTTLTARTVLTANFEANALTQTTPKNLTTVYGTNLTGGSTHDVTSIKGTGVTSFTYTSDVSKVPDGLTVNFNPNGNITVTGRPYEVTASPVTVTYTATGNNGATINGSFTIQVNKYKPEIHVVQQSGTWYVGDKTEDAATMTFSGPYYNGTSWIDVDQDTTGMAWTFNPTTLTGTSTSVTGTITDGPVGTGHDNLSAVWDHLNGTGTITATQTVSLTVAVRKNGSANSLRDGETVTVSNGTFSKTETISTSTHSAIMLVPTGTYTITVNGDTKTNVSITAAGTHYFDYYDVHYGDLSAAHGKYGTSATAPDAMVLVGAASSSGVKNNVPLPTVTPETNYAFTWGSSPAAGNFTGNTSWTLTTLPTAPNGITLTPTFTATGADVTVTARLDGATYTTKNGTVTLRTSSTATTAAYTASLSNGGASFTNVTKQTYYIFMDGVYTGEQLNASAATAGYFDYYTVTTGTDTGAASVYVGTSANPTSGTSLIAMKNDTVYLKATPATGYESTNAAWSAVKPATGATAGTVTQPAGGSNSTATLKVTGTTLVKAKYNANALGTTSPETMVAMYNMNATQWVAGATANNALESNIAITGPVTNLDNCVSNGSGNYTFTKGDGFPPFLDISGTSIALASNARIGNVGTYTFSVNVEDNVTGQTTTISATLEVKPSQPNIEKISYLNEKHYYGDAVIQDGRIVSGTKVTDPYSGADITQTAVANWTSNPATFQGNKDTPTSHSYDFTFTRTGTDADNYTTATKPVTLESVQRNPNPTAGTTTFDGPNPGGTTIKYGGTTSTVTVQIKNIGNSPFTGLKVETQSSSTLTVTPTLTAVNAISTSNPLAIGGTVNYTFTIPNSGSYTVGTYTVTFDITASAGTEGSADSESTTYSYTLTVEPAEIDHAGITTSGVPTDGGNPNSITLRTEAGANYTAKITGWKGSDGATVTTFQPGVSYTATIELTPKANYVFVTENQNGGGYYTVNTARESGTGSDGGTLVKVNQSTDKVIMEYTFKAVAVGNPTIDLSLSSTSPWDTAHVDKIQVRAADAMQFHYVITSSSTAPSAEAIKAAATGGTAVSGQVDFGSVRSDSSSGGMQIWSTGDTFSGIPGTTYYAYVVSEDVSGQLSGVGSANITLSKKLTLAVAPNSGAANGGGTITGGGLTGSVTATQSQTLAMTANGSYTVTPNNANGWGIKSIVTTNEDTSAAIGSPTTTSPVAYTYATAAGKSVITATFHKKIYGNPTISGNPNPGETISPAPNGVAIGDTTVTDFATTDDLSYQWYYGSGSTWNPIPSATGREWTVTSDYPGSSFKVVITYAGDPDASGNDSSVEAVSGQSIITLDTPQPTLEKVEVGTANGSAADKRPDGGLRVSFPKVSQDTASGGPSITYQVQLKDSDGNNVGGPVSIPATGATSYEHYWPADLTNVIPGNSFTVEVTATTNTAGYKNSDPGTASLTEAGYKELKLSDLQGAMSNKEFDGTAKTGGTVSSTITTGVGAIHVKYADDSTGANKTDDKTHVNLNNNGQYVVYVSVDKGTLYLPLEETVYTTDSNWAITQAGATLNVANSAGGKVGNPTELNVHTSGTGAATVTYPSAGTGADAYGGSNVTSYYDVTYEIISGPNTSGLTGSSFTPTAEGTYTVRASAAYKTDGTATDQFKADVGLPKPVNITVIVADKILTGLEVIGDDREATYGDTDAANFYDASGNVSAKRMGLDEVQVKLTWDNGNVETLTLAEFVAISGTQITSSLTGSSVDTANEKVIFSTAGETTVTMRYMGKEDTIKLKLNPRGLTYHTFGDDKAYDGTTNVVNPGVALDENQIFATDISLGADTVGLDQKTGLTYTLSDSSVGTGRKVMLTGTPKLTGDHAGFYTLTGKTEGEVEILPAGFTVKVNTITPDVGNAIPTSISLTDVNSENRVTDANGNRLPDGTTATIIWEWNDNGTWKEVVGDIRFQKGTEYRPVVTVTPPSNYQMETTQPHPGYTINGDKHGDNGAEVTVTDNVGTFRGAPTKLSSAPILRFKDDVNDYRKDVTRNLSSITEGGSLSVTNVPITLGNINETIYDVELSVSGNLAPYLTLDPAAFESMAADQEQPYTLNLAGFDTNTPGSYTLTIEAKGAEADGGTKNITASYTISFTVRAKPAPPSGGGTVTIEMPVVTYWVSDYGITNDLTAEKMSRKGAKPSFVPQITPIEGLKFLGWSETDPTTIKDGKLPTLVDPLTFTINDDKTFYAIYAREGYDHNHYVIGFPDGTFGPDLPITRAQVATIIARSCLGGFVEGYDYGNPGGYTDVPSKHWASSAIAFCTKSGTFNGYNDGTFQPDKNISRQELATVVARLAGVQTNQGLPFVDSADVSGWALGGVYTAYANGWIVGYKDGTFLPKNDITRAETVKIFNAYLNRGVNAEGLSDLKEYVHSGVASNNTENGSTEYMTWPDVPATHWAYFEVIEAANDHNFHWADQSAEVPPEHWEEAFINEIWNYHDAAGTTVPTAPPVQKYTVTYVLGDHGTTWASLNEEVEAGKAPVSVPYVSANEGYTFIGWSETADGTYHVDPASFTVNGNKTYYAVYEEVEAQYEIKSHTAYASGVNRSEFHPDEAVARGDVAYMLANMMGYDSSVEYDTSGLSDVEGHWARNAIGYCVEEGLLSGYTDGTFLPDGTMTRQEFAVILSRLVGLETAEGDLPFTDAGEIKNWAKDAIYTAYTSGLMSGYTDGSFQPTRTVTRAEAVKVFNSYLGREVDQDSILAAPARWTDVSVTHWAYCDIMEATVDHDWYGLDATEFWTVEE